MERTEMLRGLYGRFDEDSRLTGSLQGKLEYRTTMHYIRKLVPQGSRVLEVGAGTGRYSVALAAEGYDVTAVELVESNLEVLRRNAAGLGNIDCLQGDAADLSALRDNSFDAVLLFGPMYHLFDEEEQHRALDEAIRVAKPGGVIMAAFISVYAIIVNNGLGWGLRDSIALNFDDDFTVRHCVEQLFTGFDIAEFEGLFCGKPVKKIALAGTDSVLELPEKKGILSLSDEEFELFYRYHLATCEKRELLGSQSHLLYMCRKDGRPQDA